MSITTPREVIQVQVATNNAHSPVGAEIMAGRNRPTGEAVQVSPNQADITDALEELGMAASHKAKVDIDKVKVRKGAGTDLDALSRIAEYYEKLPDLPRDDKLRELTRRFGTFEELMRRGGEEGGSGLPTAEDLRQALAEYDSDITHQFAALEQMRQNAVKAGAPEGFLALLDTVRTDLRTEAASVRDIAAGFIAAPEAHSMAEALGADAATYRNSYREMLRDTPNIGQIFGALRGFSLTEKLEDVIDSFTKVAGADLGSFNSSTDPVQLRGVLDELSKLKRIRTALDGATEGLGKLDRMYPPEGDETRPTSAELTERLLGFAASPVSGMADAERLMAGLLSGLPEVAVAGINILRDMHAALPDDIMPNPAAREQQSRVLMSLSDRLVDAEEAAYAE